MRHASWFRIVVDVAERDKSGHAVTSDSPAGQIQLAEEALKESRRKRMRQRSCRFVRPGVQGGRSAGKVESEGAAIPLFVSVSSPRVSLSQALAFWIRASVFHELIPAFSDPVVPIWPAADR